VRARFAEPPPDRVLSFAPQQTLRRNFNAPPAVVLQSGFNLEQRGVQVRLIDRDGSVYEGPLTPAKTQVTQAAVQIPGVPFEVTGTNLTEQLRVVFQGTLGTSTPTRIQGQAVIGNRDRVNVDAVLVNP
jgi:hypothetical protein